MSVKSPQFYIQNHIECDQSDEEQNHNPWQPLLCVATGHALPFTCLRRLTRALTLRSHCHLHFITGFIWWKRCLWIGRDRYGSAFPGPPTFRFRWRQAIFIHDSLWQRFVKLFKTKPSVFLNEAFDDAPHWFFVLDLSVNWHDRGIINGSLHAVVKHHVKAVGVRNA